MNQETELLSDGFRSLMTDASQDRPEQTVNTDQPQQNAAFYQGLHNFATYLAVFGHISRL